jgi:prepilin peptidase dependent protein B
VRSCRRSPHRRRGELPVTRQMHRTMAAFRQQGFSLIEMMIGLTAGAIVVAAVLVFTVATVRANAQTVTSTRLTQDIRTSLNLVTREIRRAGYDRRAEVTIATNSPGLRFTNLTVNGAQDCLLLGYNRPEVNPGTGIVPEELKGFRRAVVNGVGVLQGHGNLASLDVSQCTGSAGWIPLTDPGLVDIQTARFALSRRCVFPDADNAPPCDPDPNGISAVVRSVDVTLGGQMVGQPDVQRTVTDSVRIRADNVQFP